MEKLKNWIVLETPPASFSDGILFSNKSLDPVPIDSKERKWEWYSVLGFWIAEAFSISMYQVLSSSISNGLSPGLAMCLIIVGHVIVSIPAMLNAQVGADYGINFPITQRYTFGVRGAKFGVFIRGVVCIFWNGVQTYQGGLALQSMLEAIFPGHIRNFKNHLPASTPITSLEMLCFWLFTLVQLPVLYLNINQLRWMFMLKTIILPIFGLVLFLWAVIVAKGFGPIFSKGNNIVDGTPTSVIFFRCMVSAIGPKATLALNITDFTRYAKDRKKIMWPQFIGLVVLVSLCGFLGIVVTSATQTIYGVLTWSPLEVSSLWNNRAAKFFSSLCWAFAIVGTNVSANTISFANDLTLFFPKIINPRRGAYICMLLAIISQPWQIQNNAKTFSSFLGGYTIFLAPPTGIMVVDYWILRKRCIDLPGLYKMHGPYHFFHGFNIPAFIAFFCGLAPNLPGLAYFCGNKGIPKGSVYLYSISYVTGVIVSGAIYCALCKLIPNLWMTEIIENSPPYTVEQQLEREATEAGIIESTPFKYSADSSLRKTVSKVFAKEV